MLYLGVPGFVFILLAIILGGYVLIVFNATRYFSLPIAIMKYQWK